MRHNATTPRELIELLKRCDPDAELRILIEEDGDEFLVPIRAVETTWSTEAHDNNTAADFVTFVTYSSDIGKQR